MNLNKTRTLNKIIQQQCEIFSMESKELRTQIENQNNRIMELVNNSGQQRMDRSETELLK